MGEFAPFLSGLVYIAAALIIVGCGLSWIANGRFSLRTFLIAVTAACLAVAALRGMSG